MNRLLLIIPLILILSNTGFAQEDDCYTILDRAEVLYEEGIIEEIPALLAPCIEKGFTREQKLRAYKLIIFAYLFDDNQIEAEKAMLNFLKKYPEYETRRSDPVEFVYLFNSYKTSIDYSFGIIGGANLSNYILTELYTTIPDPGKAEMNNSGMLGSHFGFQLNRYMGEKLEVSLEVFSARNNFRLSEEFRSEEFNTNKIKTTEKQKSWDIPISVSYIFDYKEVNPFVRAGFGMKFLSSTTLTSSGIDYDILNQRRDIDYWAFLGGGVKYKVPRGYAFVDVRYCLNLFNDVKEEERMSNDDLLFKVGYIDNNFRLDNTMISVGYILLLYRPTN